MIPAETPAEKHPLHPLYVEGPDGHQLHVGGLRITQSMVVLATSLLLGIAAGYSAVAFRKLIDIEHHLAFDLLLPVLTPALGKTGIVVQLVVGGMLTSLIIRHWAQEAKGHGVPTVLDALRLRGGVLRSRLILVKTLTAATCIGFGGSAGREGPIVLIGAAWGSAFGQLFRFPTPLMRLMLAAGSAAGIAATFNAPLGGVIFGSEVILRDFAPRSFAALAIASVAGTLVSRAYLGDHPTLSPPAFDALTPTLLISYALLGVIAAFWATGFLRFLHIVERRFDAWNFSPIVKAAIGFASVGCIGIWVPQVFGVGYDNVQHTLDGNVGVWGGLLLAFLKPVATSLTIGCGGSGGLLAPMLVTGGMLGSAFGQIAHTLLPLWTAPAATYGVVGMAAMFAAANEAPITSIAIVFEIANDYTLILPLMTASVIAALLGRRLLNAR